MSDGFGLVLWRGYRVTVLGFSMSLQLYSFKVKILGTRDMALELRVRVIGVKIRVESIFDNGGHF